MLTFWDSSSGKLCDGYSRRSFLQAGALAVGGLTLDQLLRARAHGAARTSTKAVIMVYLNGGPSHVDMYDLKLQAPAEYRGAFEPINTNVPGMDDHQQLFRTDSLSLFGLHRAGRDFHRQRTFLAVANFHERPCRLRQ